MIRIGPHTIPGKALLAPMAGVTDLPFRTLCRQFGAGLACSEMLTSDIHLWHTDKSSRRLPSDAEDGLKVVQIAGTEPDQLAAAAVLCEQLGADIIDINMGCPAKKVCKKLAGSALMKDQALVAEILTTVVGAVKIPVTLKIRTGWDVEHRNGPDIAVIAEDAGIQALSVHGRTRSCRFLGAAEYDTIAEIVQRVAIPVIANGDIASSLQAEQVLTYTGAAGVMIGRGALGKPWLFAEINQHLNRKLSRELNQELNPQLDLATLIQQHLSAMHTFYGERAGVRIARKHMAWYLKNMPVSQVSTSTAETWRGRFNGLETAALQLGFIDTHIAHTLPTLHGGALNHPLVQERTSNHRNQHFTDQAA
ncbi:MAG: tRNA dihydrouridine synthase DusB [Porticoccaceae bacterium]|nr:tRNA dihydrouridine synthase DusB [Porticoccaceae bacterium]